MSTEYLCLIILHCKRKYWSVYMKETEKESERETRTIIKEGKTNALRRHLPLQLKIHEHKY